MSAAAAPAGQSSSMDTSKPVLLLDIMDTIVTDPFFEHMPRFFNMSFKELLAAKHPTGQSLPHNPQSLLPHHNQYNP